MLTSRPKKLSWLLGLYLQISIIGFSFALLLWTYRNALQEIDLELKSSFEQRHTIAEIILESQLKNIAHQIQEISWDESFTSAVSQEHQDEAEKRLYNILDANPESPLDIAFVSISEGAVWIDANSSFFEFDPLLPEILNRKQELLSSGRILRFRKQSADLVFILKAVPIIHSQNGKMLGTLFGGLVLNDNLSLLEDIQQKTSATALVLFEHGDIIGSTDLLSDQRTRTLRALRRSQESGEIYDANALLSYYDGISLQGQSTTLEIAMAIPDRAFHALQHSYQRQGLFLLLLSLVFLLITFLSIKKLTMPSLEKLLNYSAAVSSGNLQARYIPGIITEFNQFGRAAERMVETIRSEIEERKHAEEALQTLNAELDRRVTHRTAQLEATNQELEAFAYSVSHDLRAPLRAIDGFSLALLEDYLDTLDEEGQDYLKRVRAASQRMGGMIDDLLKLSRLTRGDMRYERVDLSALAESIAEGYLSREPERKVEFSITPALFAQGDPQLLRVALENLFGNAWKFTAKEEQARIWFGVEHAEGQLSFFIRDNGAGFDMSYADKLFGAFQRLHGAREFPGTGIGLATVQRVINRHGGRIWAEGAVGQGATFYFTLPADTVKE